MAKVTVQVEAQALLDAGRWQDYCEKYGVNEWAVNEGLMSADEKLSVSLSDAKRWGLLEEEQDGDEGYVQVSWGT